MRNSIHPSGAPVRPTKRRPTVQDLVALQAAIRADFTRRILRICRQTGVKPSTVGRQSVHDPRLISRLSDESTIMGYPILRQVEQYLEDNERLLSEAGR
jgi:hypothetical protein